MTEIPLPSDHSKPAWTSHLFELRRRLLRLLAVFGIVFLVLGFYSNELYQVLALPLLKHLPQGSSLIATSLTASLVAPLRLAFTASLFVVIPTILYEIWSFVAPALYSHEKRYVLPLIVLSTFLFYLGAAFAYFVVFPLMFQFFISTAPLGIRILPDMDHYLDFSLQMLFCFACTFEIPVATILLVLTGVVTVEHLKKLRPYIVIGAFTLGMLLTPPDVISQITLAVPMWLLFELGLLLARFLPKNLFSRRQNLEKEADFSS